MLDDLLIEAVVNGSVLEENYTDISVVNVVAGQPKRGFFSIIFKAFDTTSNVEVAVKFFSPIHNSDTYRMLSFEREAKILESLKDKKRCLQINTALKTATLSLSLANSHRPLNLQVKYFVTEWIDDDIDEFFLSNSSNIDILDRLRVFRDIVLAVAALHRSNVCHRDLKPDNLRKALRHKEKVIVAIDLGTAALLDSHNIIPSYTYCVGMIPYAAPESKCGLAGIRRLDSYADIFSLGCMFYELFNVDYYYDKFDNINPNVDANVLTLFGATIAREKKEEDKINRLNCLLDIHAKGVANVSVCGCNSLIPSATNGIMQELLDGLVAFDYRKRFNNFEHIIRKVDIILKVLTHQKLYQHRIKINNASRNNRIAKRANVLTDKLRSLVAGS